MRIQTYILNTLEHMLMGTGGMGEMRENNNKKYMRGTLQFTMLYELKNIKILTLH